jgi:integrase
MKASKSSSYPKRLKEKGCSVQIYEINNGGHPQYQLSYYEGGKRKRPKFTKPEIARTKAEAVLARLVSGELESLHLTGSERQVYVLAKQKLEASCPGMSLLEAIDELTAAKKALSSDGSLKEAASEWANRHSFPPKTPSEVLAELIEAKTKLSMSAAYLKDLGRLNKFTDTFSCSMMSIRGTEIEIFLDELDMSPRTRNNYHRLIGTLFKFASARGYVPKHYDIMDSVGKAKEHDSEIEIFTPAELRELLASARPDLIPYLSIAAFSGLRSAEIQRLDWEHVNLEEGHIRVTGRIAKTASNRLAMVPDNLKAWLLPHQRASGPITPFANMSKQLDWLVRDINEARVQAGRKGSFKWKHNGMRHSSISYRLAELRDIARVSDEAGNSPQMILKHYRQLVTESEARIWFSIRPESVSQDILTIESKECR